VDGGVRDATELVGQGFPVFAKSLNIPPSEGYLEGIRLNETVVCGGVKVEPGDWLVGDDSGLVVIPAGVLDQVVILAEERDEIDAETMALVESGKPAPHRHFRDDDSKWLEAVE
jgi:regulator of RNase E activity RraA